jgi:HEAT repeat protein
VAALDLFLAVAHDTKEDARVREVAIVGLGSIDHARAEWALLELTRAVAIPVRVAAIRGLGQCRLTPAVEVILLASLNDDDAWVRYYACQALGKLRVQSAAEKIARLLEDGAGQVRVAAVEALSHLGNDVAHAALRAAASSDEPDVQRAALIGLGMMGSAESWPVLQAACAAPEAATRLVALSALGSFLSAEALVVVAAGLSDDDEGVRVAALGLLEVWPGVDATQRLVMALRDARVRARVQHALATPTQGRAAGLLVALANADDELATTLVSALGRVEQSDDHDSVYQALALSNVAARKAAVAMLAARGTPDALAALRKHAAEDPSEEVRRICTLFLTQ